MTSRGEEVQRLFDLKRPTWGAKYQAQGALANRSIRFVMAVTEHRSPPADLLDYGCGTGDISRALDGVGYSVTGCDISPEMIRMARKVDSEYQRPLTGSDWRPRRLDCHSKIAALTRSLRPACSSTSAIR